MESEEDLDAPEELTSEQGIKQDERIRRIQRENQIRVLKEGKERRRQWAQRKIQSNKSDKESVAEAKVEAPTIIHGMLPSNIVDLLAAREKQTFMTSHSEEEEAATAVNHKASKSNKKQKPLSGPETILLHEIPPAQCLLENSMDFLKRRK